MYTALTPASSTMRAVMQSNAPGATTIPSCFICRRNWLAALIDRLPVARPEAAIKYPAEPDANRTAPSPHGHGGSAPSSDRSPCEEFPMELGRRVSDVGATRTVWHTQCPLSALAYPGLGYRDGREADRSQRKWLAWACSGT